MDVSVLCAEHLARHVGNNHRLSEETEEKSNLTGMCVLVCVSNRVLN